MKKYVIPFVLTLLTSACSPKLIESSSFDNEKIYNQQLETFKEIISEKVSDTLTIIDSTSQTRNIFPKWISTVNFDLRKPNLIIIHHTAEHSVDETITTFTLPKTKVSSHYLISRDGKVIQLLNDHLRAWHAGIASWGKDTDINSSSIGIELDNDGFEEFSDAQINSLLALLSKLTKKYYIPHSNIVGHADIAPRRKEDPSKFFPWKTLAKNGFGIWYDEPIAVAPKDFDVKMALNLIGYETKDLNATVKAFKLHFMQDEVNEIIDEKTINTIYSIYLKL